MKITAFIGSARKGHTVAATNRFLEILQTLGDYDCETIMLGEQNLKICRGCKSCLDWGEETCALKDDRDRLIALMDASDGVIFATPNYSFQVSAIMKIFLDRLGFLFHRPRFFGKAWTGIVAQGIYGGKRITDYLDFVGDALGFTIVKGRCVTTREPISAKQQLQNDRIIERLARQFHGRLSKERLAAPSLLKLMIFRMSRTSIRLMLDDRYRDFHYFRDQGWFTSAYFYPVRLGPLKRALGAFFDWLARRLSARP